MHSALKFTFEKEENNQLPFLNILVENSNDGFLTSVFRKPTFTGQYFRCYSFGPTKRKTNVIETLVHRASMICWKSKLQHELETSFYEIIDTQKVLLKLPCPRKLRFSTVNQKKDRKSVQFA